MNALIHELKELNTVELSQYGLMEQALTSAVFVVIVVPVSEQAVYVKQVVEQLLVWVELTFALYVDSQ